MCDRCFEQQAGRSSDDGVSSTVNNSFTDSFHDISGSDVEDSGNTEYDQKSKRITSDYQTIQEVFKRQ